MKLKDDIIQKLEQAIQIGSTYKMACQYAGITYQTFRNWMIAGEKAQRGKKKEFYNRIREAEGKSVVGWLAKIEKAANEGNWQAAAWKLERRYPEDYGRQVHQLRGDKDQPVIIEQQEIDFSNLSDDELREYIRINKKLSSSE